MKVIASVRGTRDFYPEEMAIRTWLYSVVRDVSESFGYQEYDGPFLETLELYAAKSGEELVKEQSYVFPDRGGDLITLRPELTPTLARMVAQRQRGLVYPLRWWSWGPFWRYEKPQKGRSREFFQWNIDLIGVDTPEADAEMIAIAATFFKKVGVTPQEVNILVNNRKLMDQQFSEIGIEPEKRPGVLRLIDRREKLSPGEWKAFAHEVGLDDRQFDQIQATLSDPELWRKSPRLVRVFEIVEALGVSEYVRFAPHVIRGLLYYTETVLEAWDIEGEFRSLFGGGRYDNLVADVGGENLPAVGFAMGDMVLGLVLAKLGRLPQELHASPAAVLVTVFDEASLTASFTLASELRAAGLNVAVYPEAARLGKQFKYGDRMGMRIAAVIGPDELANRQVAIKDLRSGEQETVDRAGCAGRIQALLGNSA